MVRDDDEDDLADEFRELGYQERNEDEDPDDSSEEAPPPEYSTGEAGVQVSMEIDEDGNEVWYAKDSKVPGSSSMGHSVEEAVEGVEDRRRLYREMKQKSREERKQREDVEE